MFFSGLLPSGRGLAAIALFAWAAVPAFAGGEISYSDSFGNLVVHSPGGYKRIVVGRGHLAAGPRAQGPKVVYLEERDGALYLRERRRCRHGVRLHGRSYMYGLPENVLPVPAASCR
ncbi:hypothetical protein [Chelativorans intermedius]|uniref:Secreted protein n=1 Tax=Chelativorans intermedius TaxID=515947 RepID=A0ABV6D7B3_9HYPH|nr:hypothetical protein [Chelativorans intermedius]MCT8999311.1 hypothetical protein [Chelativorans intermedius]